MRARGFGCDRHMTTDVGHIVLARNDRLFAQVPHSLLVKAWDATACPWKWRRGLLEKFCQITRDAWWKATWRNRGVPFWIKRTSRKKKANHPSSRFRCLFFSHALKSRQSPSLEIRSWTMTGKVIGFQHYQAQFRFLWFQLQRWFRSCLKLFGTDGLVPTKKSFQFWWSAIMMIIVKWNKIQIFEAWELFKQKIENVVMTNEF